MSYSNLTTESQALSIGGYSIHSIETGEFALDGGAMFGTVPKVLWEKMIPSHENNTIPLQARAMLLKGHGEVILVDTGNGGDFVEKYGEKLGSKFQSMYGVKEHEGLFAQLEKHGVHPHEVTQVILTHLHFDHAGGAVSWKDELVPSFPNAQYWIQKENLITARSPNLREKASYLAVNFDPLLKAGVVELLDGATEDLFPNLHLTLSHGHTQGQQLVWLQDETQALVYAGDLIPTAAHLKLPWLMGYDLHPLQIMEEKKQTYEKLLKHPNAYVFFEHDPYVDAVKLNEEGMAQYALKL